jgi:short-subunit dehydrogenase
MRKLIVVTGGSQGIGRAIVSKFATEDFDVVTCARHAGDLEVLKMQIEKLHPGASIFYKQTDMTVRAQVDAFAAFVLSLNRPVSVLVNNAGYFVPGEISTEPEGNLESMINANLYSAYHLTRALVGDMKHNKSGHIFNMCSIASIQAYPNGGSYAISKFALLGFSKCLREELKGFQIRVTAVLPGATNTRSWAGAGLPEERFIRPEDVAAAVYSAHALSPHSVVEEIIIRPQEGDI